MDRQSDAKIFPTAWGVSASEALGRKEATAAVPHRGFIGLACTAHPTEGARQRGADARGKRPEAGDSKGDGGGRRGDLSGWLPANGLQAKEPWRPLVCPSFFLQLTIPLSSQHSRFTRQSRDQMTLTMTSDDGVQIGWSPWTAANSRQPGPRSATSLDLRRNIVRYLAVVAGVSSIFPVLWSFC